MEKLTQLGLTYPDEKYYYLSLAVIALIFIWRISAGFKKGMVKEWISLIAMFVSGVCMILLIGALATYLNREVAQMVQIIIVLAVVGIVYRLISIPLSTAKWVTKLPCIRGVDKLLGAVIGAAEAGVIVMCLIHLIKNWGRSFL